MRLVLWKSQERVDLPDMEVLSSFVLGEFRRTVRGILLGDNGSGSYDNLLIQGFKVEQAAVPNTTVVVKMDPGGANPFSFAIGAENANDSALGPFDHGALIGGDDSIGNIEGNASYSFDFTGEPVAVYGLYMRFVYADGSSDNRAKWDEVLNSESVAAQDTRRLPGIELQIDPSPLTQEWVHLADVDWDGAGPIVTADITDQRKWAFEWDLPFSQTTKSGTGGMPDFNRSSDRATNGVNEVYPALRALARQIQDIKGQGDDGTLSWWARPAKPWDPDGLLAGASFSRSMRSLETVTYTIGDGVTTFGDFNGADGLEDCLAHLEASTTIPNYIEILLRGGPGIDFNLGAHDFSAFTHKHLAIRGRGNIDVNSGNASIIATTTDATTLLLMGTSSAVTLEDLSIYGADNAVGGQSVVSSQRVYLNRVELLQGLDTTIANTSAVGVACTRLQARDSYLQGHVTISEDATAHNCFFGAPIIKLTGANKALLSSCSFTNCQSLDGEEGVLQLAGSNIEIQNCLFELAATNGSVDAIRIVSAVAGQANHKITGCQFDWGRATHSVGAGHNTTDGTGWCIFVGPTAVASHIRISGNLFRGQGTQTYGVVDAGAIALLGGTNLVVSENTFENWQPITGVASATCDLIRLGTSAGGATIAGNIFGAWGEHASVSGVAQGRVIYGDAVAAVRVNGNSISGRNSAGNAITVYILRGINVSANACLRWIVTGNYFTGVENRALTGAGFQEYWNIANNTFFRCQNAVQGFFDYSVISGNIFSENTSVADNGIDILGDYTTIVGNVLDVPAGDDGITNASVLTAFVGNVGTGDIDGTATAVGYNYAADLNIANAYI